MADNTKCVESSFEFPEYLIKVLYENSKFFRDELQELSKKIDGKIDKSFMDIEYETRATEDYDAEDFEDSWSGKFKRDLIPSLEIALANVAYAMAAGDLPKRSRERLAFAYMKIDEAKDDVLEARYSRE